MLKLSQVTCAVLPCSNLPFRFDGALGVIVAIAAVKHVLVKEAAPEHTSQHGTESDIHLHATDTRDVLPVPIHIVAFTDEEGVRFGSTFLGSRALVSFHVLGLQRVAVFNPFCLH